jgi:Flp pilus assembly protein TadD
MLFSASMPRSSRLLDLAILVLLAASTVLAYAHVGRCAFVNFDDPAYVTENAQVKHGLTVAGVRWAFTTLANCNWHPLTWLSHMLDYQLFGLAAGAHHRTSLAFHVLDACLLYLVLRRMTEAPWRSAAVAGLFALHPLHVESVAWIAERKDVLSALFALLTIAAWVEHVKRRSRVFYALALVLFALALLSKPMVVTLPFVLVLLDLWPLGRLRRGAPDRLPRETQPDPLRGGARKQAARERAGARGAAPARAGALVRGAAPAPLSLGALLAEKTPFFALAAFGCVMTLIAQTRGGAAISIVSLTPGMRVANAAVSYVAYLGKLVWPARLCAFYPLRRHLPGVEWLGALAALLVITGLVAWQWKRRPYLPVGWAWYLGTLVPVIGLVQVGAQSMADRYTYLPSIGIALMAVWLIADAAPRWSASVLAALGALLCVALVARTRDQVRTWTDDLTLYQHALAVTSHNARMEKNYGATLQRLGRNADAVRALDAAIRDEPRWADPWYNRGMAKEGLGDLDGAAADYAAAARLEPTAGAPHLRLASLAFARGRYDEALREFESATRLAPGDVDAWDGLGATLASLGRYREAEAPFRRALALRPGYEFALRNLEKLRALRGNDPSKLRNDRALSGDGRPGRD